MDRQTLVSHQPSGRNLSLLQPNWRLSYSSRDLQTLVGIQPSSKNLSLLKPTWSLSSRSRNIPKTLSASSLLAESCPRSSPTGDSASEAGGRTFFSASGPLAETSPCSSRPGDSTPGAGPTLPPDFQRLDLRLGKHLPLHLVPDDLELVDNLLQQHKPLPQPSPSTSFCP